MSRSPQGSRKPGISDLNKEARPVESIETFTTTHANAKLNVKREVLHLHLHWSYLQSVLHKNTNKIVVSFHGVLGYHVVHNVFCCVLYTFCVTNAEGVL